MHHDALEFPDGTFVLLTDLHEGQQATVLQLPAQPKTLAEARSRRASSTLADIRWITRLIGIGGPHDSSLPIRRVGGFR